MVREDLIVSPSHNLIWSNLLVTLLQKVEFVLYFIFPSTNKIDEHGVAEIYFKVVLNTLILILNYTIVFNLFLIFLTCLCTPQKINRLVSLFISVWIWNRGDNPNGFLIFKYCHYDIKKNQAKIYKWFL